MIGNLEKLGLKIAYMGLRRLCLQIGREDPSLEGGLDSLEEGGWSSASAQQLSTGEVRISLAACYVEANRAFSRPAVWFRTADHRDQWWFDGRMRMEDCLVEGFLGFAVDFSKRLAEGYLDPGSWILNPELESRVLSPESWILNPKSCQGKSSGSHTTYILITTYYVFGAA
jgi:hypothetical protein